MKRLCIITVCFLSPLLLASGEKCKLPRGGAIAVAQALIDEVDTGKNPRSPIQEDNLGFFDEESSVNDDLPINNDERDLSIDENYFSDQAVPPTPAQITSSPIRPLSPADRSQNWRANQESPKPFGKSCQFGKKIFTPAPATSRADHSQNWRRDQGQTPTLVVIGSAMHFYKRTSR